MRPASKKKTKNKGQPNTVALNKADIICLQGVDHYYEFYKDQISSLGYTHKVVWHKSQDLLLTGWDNKKYRFLDSMDIEYDTLVRKHGPLIGYKFKQGNVGLITLLRHIESGRKLIVVNSNICQDPELDFVRYAQGDWLLKCIGSFVRENDLFYNVPIIVCSDLKQSPDSSIVHRLLDKPYPFVSNAKVSRSAEAHRLREEALDSFKETH